MEESMQGKHFSITDPKNVSTIIYQINKTEKELAKNSPKYTVERLEYTQEIVGENTRKTFYVDNFNPQGNKLAILSFGNDRVVVNNGILQEDKVIISKKPMPFKFKTIFNEEETELKDVEYTPNLQRPIAIIDPETTEEIKPTLYFDENTNEVRGKCKLKPNKTYFAFEIRDITNDGFKLVGGTPTFT